MQVFRAGVIYAAANVASAAVPFLLLPLLTRILMPADYGRVVTFGLLTTLCMPFAGLSVHSATSVAWFNRPREEIPAFNATALVLIVCTSLIVAGIAALLMGIEPWNDVNFPPLWGAIAALTAGANVALQCRLMVWQSQGKPASNAITQFAASFLNVGLSLVAVLVFGWGGDGRNAGIASAAFLMACVACLLFFASGDAAWSFRRDHLRSQVHYGLPLIPHVLAGAVLGTIDRWMVSAQLGTEVLGVYGAGAQLGMVMSILADAFVKAYNPWLYSQLASSDTEDSYCIVGVIYAAAPAFLCLGAIVGVALYCVGDALLGLSYRDALTMLPWFMLGGAFSGVYFSISSIYFFSGRTGLLASATTSAALLGIIIVWILVALFGIHGAAIGYAAIQATLALFAAVVAVRSFDLPWFEAHKAICVFLQRAGLRKSLN